MGNMLNRSAEEREKIRRDRLKEYLARLSTETAAPSLNLNLIQDLIIALSFFKHDDHIKVTSHEKDFSQRQNNKRPVLNNQQPDRGSLTEGPRSNDFFKRVPQHQIEPRPFAQTSLDQKSNINLYRKEASYAFNTKEPIFSPNTHYPSTNPQLSRNPYEHSYLNKEEYGSNYRTEVGLNAGQTESVYKTVQHATQYSNVPTYISNERQAFNPNENQFRYETNRSFYNQHELLASRRHEKPNHLATESPYFNERERLGYNSNERTGLFTNESTLNSTEEFGALNKNEKFPFNTKVSFNSREKDSRSKAPDLNKQNIPGKTYAESKESTTVKDKQFTTFESKPYTHFYNQPKPQGTVDRTAGEFRANRHQSMDPPQNLKPRGFQPDAPNLLKPSSFNQPNNSINNPLINSKRNQSMDPPQNPQPRHFQNSDSKNIPQFPGFAAIHQSKEPANPLPTNSKFPSLRSQPAQAPEKPVDHPYGFNNISAAPQSNPFIMSSPQNPPLTPASSKFSMPAIAIPNKAVTETRIKPVSPIRNLCYHCKQNESTTDDCEHKYCKPCLKSAYAKVSNGTFLGRLYCNQCSTEIKIDSYFGGNEFKEQRLKAINYLRNQCIIDVTSAHFLCIICNEEVLVNESITLSCEHRSCEPCICKFVTEKIQTNALSEIKCPQCEAPIDYNVISNITDKATLDQYQKFSTRTYEPLEKNAVPYWCPYCSIVYEIDKSMQKFVCNGCKKEICVKCNSEHPGISCKEYLLAGKANLGEYNYIVCPGCNEAIEPGDGCNFYVCKYPGCNTNFCKLCKKVLDASQHHSHFKTSGPFGKKCNTLEGIPDEI